MSIKRKTLFKIYLKKIKINFLSLTTDYRFSEIFKGSVWALSARTFGLLLSLIFGVFVARIYGAKVVGILAVINAFFVLVNICTVLGTSTSILMMIPEHITKYSSNSAFKVYCKTQYIVIGSSVITSILMFFCANIIAEKIFLKPTLGYYFAISSVFIVFRSLMLLNTNSIRGLHYIKLFAVMQILPQVFNLFFLIILGWFLDSIDIPFYSILLGYAATGIIGSLSMQIAFRKIISPDEIINPISTGNILSISLPMLLTATMMFLITQTGILILGMYRTEAEIGYYSVAVKLATLTTFMLQSVTSMAAPKFSELFHLNKLEDLFHVAKKSTKLIFFSTVPILVFLLLFGKFILNEFYGADFEVAYWALVFLVVGQFINSASGATASFMNMTGNQKFFKNIMLVTAGLNVGLNFWLIPISGINGAAFSAMISLCFWNVATLLYMKVKFGKTTAYFPFIF